MYNLQKVRGCKNQKQKTEIYGEKICEGVYDIIFIWFLFAIIPTGNQGQIQGVVPMLSLLPAVAVSLLALKRS